MIMEKVDLWCQHGRCRRVGSPTVGSGGAGQEQLRILAATLLVAAHLQSPVIPRPACQVPLERTYCVCRSVSRTVPGPCIGQLQKRVCPDVNCGRLRVLP